MEKTAIEAVELTEVVHRLRREMRVWRSAGCILVIVLALFLLAGGKNADGPPDFVVAKRGFLLVDNEGRNRALLGFGKEGDLGLVLVDENKISRVSLLVTKGDRCGLEVTDRDDNLRLVTGYEKVGDRDSGQFGMFLYDKVGFGRLAVGQLESGLPGISLRDKEGRERLFMGESDDDTPEQSLFGLVVFDRFGNQRIRVGHSEADGSLIGIVEPKLNLCRIALEVPRGGDPARLFMRGAGVDERLEASVDRSNSMKFLVKTKEGHTIDMVNRNGQGKWPQ